MAFEQPSSGAATSKRDSSSTEYATEGPQLQAPKEVEAAERKEEDEFMVKFEPGDPASPKNWSYAKKWYMTMAAGFLVFNAAFASSAPSGVLGQLIRHFHLSHTLAILSISLFVAAYCVGPLLWGPLSEQYGRRPIFLLTFIPYVAFQVGCALSHNTASLLIFRFLGGFFAAAPLTNSGAILADIWDARHRGTAMAVFTLMPFAGPAFGPLVSGYINVGGASWRWLFWTLAIFAGCCWFLIFFTMPETYEPVLLVRMARRKRKETGDARYYAPMEKTKLPLAKRVQNVLGRPTSMLINEPMLLAITIYMSFVYGCIYLLFESYPVVFITAHHMNTGSAGLMFLAIPVGGLIGIIVYIFYFNPKYEAEMARHAPHPVPPEYRLHVARWGGFFFALSYFWFGWTSYSSVSYWAPLTSGIPSALGVLWIFLPLFNYVVDTYLFSAASALTVLTVVRSMFGAAFPLFATQMYETLNPRWASTLLGCIALLLWTIPFALIKYGPALRAKSKYAPSRPAPPVAEKSLV